MIGHALSADRTLRIPLPAVVAAGVTAIFCLAWPAPMGSGSPVTAEVTLEEVGEAPHRTALITARLDPPDAAEDAVWWHGLAWQGLNWDRGSSKIVELEEVDNGIYRTVRPLPVGGDWKSLLRLHVDDRLLAVPVYLPRDSAIPAPVVPARSSFERSFVTDKQIVQREAVTSNIGLQRIAYGLLLLIGIAWIAIFGWALRRLGHTDMRRQRQTPPHARLQGAAASS